MCRKLHEGVLKVPTGVFEDLRGKVFGYLTVIDRAPDAPRGKHKKRVMWNCRCVCGKMKIVAASKLKSGSTKSCGCMSRSLQSKLRSEDLCGKKIGRLTVISRATNHVKPSGQQDVCWNCECECGNSCVKRSEYLKKSPFPSCGCWKSEITSEAKCIDLSGQTFGRLEVIERIGTHRTTGGNHPKARYLCLCSCGEYTITTADALRNGYKQSCGCLKRSDNESKIFSLLRDHQIEFSTEYSFCDLLSDTGFRLRFDFAIFKGDTLKLLIEHQGEQHYYPTNNDMDGFIKLQRRDQLKREYCAAHGIPLYEIRFDHCIESELTKALAMHVDFVPSTADAVKV